MCQRWSLDKYSCPNGASILLGCEEGFRGHLATTEEVRMAELSKKLIGDETSEAMGMGEHRLYVPPL